MHCTTNRKTRRHQHLCCFVTVVYFCSWWRNREYNPLVFLCMIVNWEPQSKTPQDGKPSMVTALQHGTWMDEKGFKKTCIREKKKRGDIHQPFYGAWVADFMLRQDAGGFMLGKYLSNKRIPWQRRRQLEMAVAGHTPTARILTKIGKMQSAGCRLCRKAQEARGGSTDGLVDETQGHINSAGCEGMATTVTAAHHSTWRNLYDSMHAAQKPKAKLKFVTLDKESIMSTLWRREEFLRICSKEELAEKTQDIEVTIPVKKNVKRHGTTLIQGLSP